VLLTAEGQLLMLRRHNTGWCDGLWSVPAGHVQVDETITAAAVREAEEETGVILEPDRLAEVHVMHRPARDAGGGLDRVDFFFHALPGWSGAPSLREPDKCDGIDWFSMDALPDMPAYLRAAITRANLGMRYSEFGW
jgi:8-oxo-dGTP pyrophosphatase MutT (NUDIX family)